MNKKVASTLNQFLVNTINGVFQDDSDQRTFTEKIAKAAIESVPRSIELGTDAICDKLSDRFPNLELSNDNRPKDIMELSAKAVDTTTKTHNELKTIVILDEGKRKQIKS